MYFWRHNHLYLWNYLQLDLLPTWFEQLQHNWSPKFDLHLVSSPRTSQSSQFSDLMPSSTIHLASPSQKASNQRSQLEHPSYFSNPSPMDERNKLSLYLDTFSLPTLQRVAGGNDEASRSILFSTTLPSPFHPTSTPIHSYICFIFSINPYHYPPSHDPPYFCALMRSLSINKKYYLALFYLGFQKGIS